MTFNTTWIKPNLRIRLYQSLKLLLINVLSGVTTSRIENVYTNGHTIAGVTKRQTKDALAFLQTNKTERPVARFDHILLRACGPRFTFGCFDSHTGHLVGISFYYINLRDWREGTIHEGFTGLKAEFRGQGLGSALRDAAIAHFKRNGFRGISSRVSESNQASLKSNQRLGFKIQETYFDRRFRERRHYMIHDLHSSDQ